MDQKNNYRFHYNLMLSKILLLNLALGCITSLCAQDRTVDSLKSSLATAPAAALSGIYRELAAAYLRTDDPRALEYARKAYQVASQHADSLAFVKAGIVMGQVFEKLDKLDSALILFSKMLPVATRHRFDAEYEVILNSMATAYTFKAQYDKALEQYFECLQSKRGRGQTSEVRFVLRDIGFLYYKLEDYPTALQYFEQALQLKGEDRDPAFENRILMNVSLCHAFTGDMIGARKNLEKVLADNKDEAVAMEALHVSGVMQLKSGELAEAETSFLRSLEAATAKEAKRLQFENIDGLSEIYLRRNQLDLAEQYLKRAEAMAKDAPLNRERISLYFRFAALYKRREDYTNMADYQEKYILLKDSIFSDQLTNNLMRIESEYQEWKNKTQLTAQGQLLALKNEVITRQNLLNILAGVVAVLLFVLVFALWKSNRQRKLANHKLDRKVKERTLELESSHRALRQEVEQRDVAIVKTLTEINSAVATMRGLCSVGLQDGNDTETRKCLEEISAVTGRVTSALNRIQEDEDKNEGEGIGS
jgi:tetratricopeptide (TPR) repeat protein